MKLRMDVLALMSLVALVPRPVPAQKNGRGSFGPAPSRLTTAQALKKAPVLDKGLVPLQRKFDTAAAALRKRPKDARAKTAYVQDAYAYGHAIMLDRGKMPPAIQYRAALALFRKALVVDPKHKPSRDDKDLIESIYKQMGVGIPK